MYCRSNLILDFFHYDQRLMRAFFRLMAGVRFRMQFTDSLPDYNQSICRYLLPYR